MSKVIVFLADGFEETEALCPVDVLRRAGIDVVIAGVGSELVTSSHGVTVKADTTVEDLDSNEQFSAVFCPGGMPGSVNLSQSWSVNEIIVKTAQTGIVAAICAAPAVVLAPLGLLKGRNATCFPGCESYAPDMVFSKEGVVVDGNIVTAKSAGWAFDLGLTLVSLLKGNDEAEKVRKAIYYKEKI